MNDIRTLKTTQPDDTDEETLLPESQWTFSSIETGGAVEFSIAGVDDKFLKMTGSLKRSDTECAVFVNLNGVSSVKQKFHPGYSIVITHGNRVYFSRIIELKSMILTVENPPYKVISRSNKRIHERHDCSITAIMNLEQRTVMREKKVTIRNLSREGCCIAIQRSKDDMATGLSVGKPLTINIEIKNRQFGFTGTIKNVRKDNEDETIKYAGVAFEGLSTLSSEMLNAIINRLEQNTGRKKQSS